MSIKYFKLLDMLNKKGMSKGELQKMAGFSSATMAKLSSHKPINLSVIDAICTALNCQPGDIMEHIPDAEGYGILGDVKIEKTNRKGVETNVTSV